MQSYRKPGLAVTAPPASVILGVTFELLESLDSAVSLSVALLMRYGEWDQLVSKKIDPVDYNDALSFKIDYLAVSVLSKSEFLDTTIDRREAATKSFLAAERACAETNQRIDLYSRGQLMPTSLSVHRVLHSAREWLRDHLGHVSSYAHRGGSLTDSGFTFGRFGPGVTSLTRTDVCSANKYASELHLTPRLFSYWRDVTGPWWARLVKNVTIVASSRVTFVPKNAKTFRTICVEPHLNGYAQLGIAALLRKGLLRAGIDLSVQADFNRWACKVAAQTGRFATIDLRAASDTIARAVVWLLFPEEWANLMDIARAHFGELNGVEFEFEKFSAMGNGFTFELETLLFRALCHGAGSPAHETEVFGDDLIVPNRCVAVLKATLDFLGFTINSEKTFETGPFRESCGVDRYLSTDVRPFFWKDLNVELWFKVANDLRDFSAFPGLDPTRAKAVAKVRDRFIDRVPKRLQLFVPEGFGSHGIVDERCVTYPLPDGHCGRSFRGLLFKPAKQAIYSHDGALAHCLDGASYEGRGSTSFRGVGYYKVSSLRSISLT